MIRTQAHKQTQHQVFIRAAQASYEHGKAYAAANVVPGRHFGLTAHDLEKMGYTTKSERDLFREGYFDAIKPNSITTDRDGIIVSVS